MLVAHQSTSANGKAAPGPSKALDDAPQADQIRRLRRALIRQFGIKGRLDAYKRSLVRHAVAATYAAQAAMNDPATDANSRVRLSNMARKARADLATIVSRSEPPRPNPLEAMFDGR